MTKNQKNLIIFIHEYHSQNDIVPSLAEMVVGIKVSANNSVLRAIKSLVKKGYLARIGAKTSSVIPTYEALRELGLHPLKSYTIVGDSTKIEQPRDLVHDEATITLETGFIPPLGADIKKSDGTRFNSNQLKNIVQSAVNLALSNHSPEKLSIFNILKTLPLNRRSEWTILAIAILGFSVLFIGKNILAIGATCGILFTIFIISNQTK